VPAFTTQHHAEIYKAFVPRGINYLEPTSGGRAVNKIVFDLASKCNLTCSYCFASQGHYGSQHFSKVPLLSADDAIEIVDRICAEVDYVAAVKFFGGEPLLNPDGIDAVCRRFLHHFELDHISRLPKYNIVTNGTIFSSRVAKLLRANAIRTTVSLDGYKSTHDTERKFANNKGSFDTIAHNIGRLFEAGVKTNIIESVFNVTHIADGYDIYGVYKYIKDRFAGQVDTVVVHPLDRSGLEGVRDDDNKTKYIRTMRSNARDSYSRIILEEFYEGKQDRFDLAMKNLTSPEKGQNLCEVGYDTFTIKTDGSVYSCYIFSGNKDFRAPNVRDKQFWEEFYSGVFAGRMAKANRFESAVCNACAVQPTCSHCLSGMSVKGGMDGLLPDIYCEYYLGQIEGFIDALTSMKLDGKLDQIYS
jgi:uncharacterized protein